MCFSNKHFIFLDLEDSAIHLLSQAISHSYLILHFLDKKNKTMIVSEDMYLRNLKLHLNILFNLFLMCNGGRVSGREG